MANPFANKIKNSLVSLEKERELLLSKIKELKNKPQISAEDKEKLEKIEQSLEMPKEEIQSSKDVYDWYEEN